MVINGPYTKVLPIEFILKYLTFDCKLLANPIIVCNVEILDSVMEVATDIFFCSLMEI